MNASSRFWPVPLLGLLTGVAIALLAAGSPLVSAQDKDKKDKDKQEKKEEPKQPEKKEVPRDKTPPVMILKGHKDWINSVAVSPDGKYLVTASRDRTIKIWDAAAGKEVKTLEKNPGNVRSAIFSPDGKAVVSASGGWNKKEKKWEGEIKFWDPQSGKELRTLKGHSDEIRALAFSPDGKYLVTAGEDQTAIIWDVQTGKELHTLKGHKETILSAAFNKDGTKLATGSAAPAAMPDPKDKKGKKDKKEDKKDDKSTDPSVKLWEVQSGKELHTLTGADRDITSVAFSPDGKIIAGASLEGKIRLWDDSGKDIRTLEAPEGIWSIDFSPDGKYLAAGGWNDTIKVYEAASGKELLYRNGHERTVTSVTFSPDSHRLITSGIDQTVKVWEMPK